MGLTNIYFNRVINVSFKDTSGRTVLFVKCPTNGRKPNIELNGSSVCRASMSAFHLKIKNLYIDTNLGEYATVTVNAGYLEGKTVTFSGAIQYMYQEAPGPEGSTIIQCIQGTQINDILRVPLQDIGDTKNKTLKSVLSSISQVLGLEDAFIDKDLESRTIDFNLILTNTAAGEALEKIIAAFQQKDEVLYITYSDNRLRAFTNNSSEETINGITKQIKYLCTPPQVIAGENTDSIIATFGAPYDPDIKVGDLVTINTNFYKTKSYKASTSGKVTYKVNNIQFQFATCGSMNQMIIQGVKI